MADKQPERKQGIIDGSDEVAWMKSMISHNVRMPISIISGYGELLKKGLISEEKKAECIDKICRNIDYLAHIINLILDENDTPDRNLTGERFNLVTCVSECAGYVDTLAKKSGIEIVTIAPKKKVMVNGDYNQFMRLLYNLFENSIKYMNKEGTITITVDEPDRNSIILIYKDNGVGMNKDEAVHIMEKNYRGSNSVHGDGMGMYYVAEVVRMHHGEIQVNSSIGKGMNIIITFPNIY